MKISPGAGWPNNPPVAGAGVLPKRPPVAGAGAGAPNRPVEGAGAESFIQAKKKLVGCCKHDEIIQSSRHDVIGIRLLL